MSFVRKTLKNEYGIRVRKIRIWGTPNYWGDVYYLPYRIAGCNAGSVVDLVGEGKVYKSPEDILEKARKGELL